MTDVSATRSPFAAVDPAIGYLYQVRIALLLALRRVRAAEEFLLLIENLDDVVFETDGTAPELLQTKHHRDYAANLTDASTDLWRTLRIWCEGTTNGTISSDAAFCLITTTEAGSGSAASYLRSEERDVARARERLMTTAQSSTSRENQRGYSAFNALDEMTRTQLLGRVTVIDKAPTITNLNDELRREIRWAAKKEHVSAFLTRLEGWWYQRVIKHLTSDIEDPILSQEIEAQMDDLREQFKQDSLPIDDNILAVTVNSSEYENAPFVEQLKLIDIGGQRILAAIREYFRAFEQRSRWVREDLVFVGELEQYERRLVEEWELVFERAKDDLGSTATEELKREAARRVYQWVEESVFPIRPKVIEPFVTRGSYQMLSERLRVGWHPEFKVRLQHLLEAEEDLAVEGGVR